MSAVGAQIGNANAAKGKDWQHALRKALVQYDDDKVQAGQALNVIARVVVKGALNGDMACINEIGNRMDGKPAQSLTVSGDDDKPLITMIKMVIVEASQGETLEHGSDDRLQISEIAGQTEAPHPPTPIGAYSPEGTPGK